MRKYVFIAVATIGLVGISGCYGSDKTGPKAEQVAAPKESVAIGAKVVDANSRQNLGVGLSALAILAKSGANSYLLEDALQPAELQGIKELEIAGYVIKRERADRDGNYIVLIPTAKGLELKSALGWQTRGAP